MKETNGHIRAVPPGLAPFSAPKVPRDLPITGPFAIIGVTVSNAGPPGLPGTYTLSSHSNSQEVEFNALV